MSLDKRFYIHTGRDGILKDTDEDDVRALVADLKSTDKIVIHLHGGLVSKTAAMDKAERIVPAYLAAGVRPVFMVWESGFLETISNNLEEINKEKIFSVIVKLVLKFAVGKLSTLGVARSAGRFWLPTDIEVSMEFNKRSQPGHEVPYRDFKPRKRDSLTENERNHFEQTLAADRVFRSELLSIAHSNGPDTQALTQKGAAAHSRKSTKTLMSPEIIEEIVEEVGQGKLQAKGLSLSVGIVKKVGKILWRVIDRYKRGRDHGLYTTVLEEVLRELYIANVGAVIWDMMKKDTEDTFDNVGQEPTRAGWFLMQELGKLMHDGFRPQVSVVAHSAGAIYASHFLKHLAWARANSEHPLPNDFRLKNLIFLAPACSFSLFGTVLDLHQQEPLFDHFRMFALSDTLESGYWEVPGVYPRSLLYFVSGIVEQENGESAHDLPLVGMQRYFDNAEVYPDPDINRVRQLLGQVEDKRSEVWSESNRGGGLSSDTLTHGGFDSTDERKMTIESVGFILKSGW
ncbi:hypothetical protein [Pseudomonas laurylsulfatiphila]|uniref:hypothetical protein n=1 Tax=Pseudomonas laurylsulfatiphila TaxID=2011015 RepID=UPI003D21A3DB